MDAHSGHLRIATLIGAAGLLAGITLLPGGAAAQKDGTAKQAAEGKLRASVLTTPAGITRTMPSLSGGAVNAALVALRAFSAADQRAEEAGGGEGPDAAGTGAGTPRSLGCSERTSNGNVRVNQDCTYHFQAEESIIYNPAHPDNLVAGQNDGRVGPNQCGIDWTLNNGQNWGDMLPPFRNKLNLPAREEPTASDPNRHTILGGAGTLHTYDFASDPTVAMDSRGTAYFGCVALDIFSNASLLWVAASPAAAEGSFFFNISPAGRRYVIAEDNNPDVFHDKPFLVADKYATSPNRDNVYVTWTVFRFSETCFFGFCSSPIFGSMSTDHGHTWSTPEEISGSSTSLCFFGDFFDNTRAANACDFDQGSDPTVLQNGQLEVIFNNLNTDATNPNAQQLGVHCSPSGSSPAGTAHFNCAAPAKVGDDVLVGEPFCDFGRGPEECIPGAYIRTNDFPRINKNTLANNHLYATWQDYRNGEFDIQLAASTDGGKTWKEAGTLNKDRGRDHYMPAVELALTSSGGGEDEDNADRVGDSYFRTDRVPNENAPVLFGCPPGTTTTAPFTCSGTGPKNSDYVLAGGTGTRTPYNFAVISPAFAPPDGVQSGFNGDYSGLTINRGTEAHPIWSDTRNTNPFPENGSVHDEDIFTITKELPR